MDWRRFNFEKRKIYFGPEAGSLPARSKGITFDYEHCRDASCPVQHPFNYRHRCRVAEFHYRSFLWIYSRNDRHSGGSCGGGIVVIAHRSGRFHEHPFPGGWGDRTDCRRNQGHNVAVLSFLVRKTGLTAGLSPTSYPDPQGPISPNRRIPRDETVRVLRESESFRVKRFVF
jgi:hypothetical protein